MEIKNLLQEYHKETEILESLNHVLDSMKAAKPEERSELSRRYAVTITELEKVIAYYWLYVCHAE